MSGHSKWSNIKNKKAANDAVKGKIFTKLAKAITVAARTGHGMNLAIEKAREASMPKENIDRAIEKGTGGGGTELIELKIEGFGPGGFGVIIEAITDNSNRTIAEVRCLMEKYGGKMGEIGSVAYMFEKKDGAYIPLYLTPVSDKEAATAFLEAISEDDDVQEIYANLE